MFAKTKNVSQDLIPVIPAPVDQELSVLLDPMETQFAGLKILSYINIIYLCLFKIEDYALNV